MPAKTSQIVTESQLFDLYEKRDQLQSLQKQLMQSQPEYQFIPIDTQQHPSPDITDAYLAENNQLKQQLAQQMHWLNTRILIHEDKLSRIEAEAMQWINGTGRNERREITRTHDGIIAESTLKSANPNTNSNIKLNKSDVTENESDVMKIVFIGLGVVLLIALLNAVIDFIQKNPEVMVVSVIVVIGLFFISRRGA